MSLQSQLRPAFRQWITLFCIVCVHGGILYLAMKAIKQHNAEPVRFLSLIKVSAKPKPVLEPSASLPSQRKTRRPQTTSTQSVLPLPTENASTMSSKAATAEAVSEAKPTLNLDDLHELARKNERARPISGMEKLQASQKLNLSIEAKIDRELNKVILPECRAMLLGMPIIERMQIIQNHNQKKFCRAEK